MKLVVEPSGALGLAALLSGAVKPSGRTGVIVSGGNVDDSTMSRILEGSTRRPGCDGQAVPPENGRLPHRNAGYPAVAPETDG